MNSGQSSNGLPSALNRQERCKALFCRRDRWSLRGKSAGLNEALPRESAVKVLRSAQECQGASPFRTCLAPRAALSSALRLQPAANPVTGDRRDYALDAAPLDDTGGQALVFRARHKPSDAVVALKRLRSPRDEDAVARMRREIEIGRALDGHPHAMPILDADPDATWFVMPLASGNLADFRSEVLSTGPRKMIEEVVAALQAAHEHGWVHRDVKPANVLRLELDGHVRWVLADWGLARRPPGDTTAPGRTRVGVSFGTLGFAAPELAVDAHGVTASADIFSMGQMIGWLLTGQWPQPNIGLLPDAGPWRQIVREATAFEPSRRPQDVDGLLALMSRELDEPPRSPMSIGEGLLEQARAGRMEALGELFALAGHNPDDVELYIDVLPQLKPDEVVIAIDMAPDAGVDVANALREQVHCDWHYRSFRWADSVIRFALRLAMQGVRIGRVDLVEAGSEALFSWDDSWDQWPPQSDIRSWLRALRGDSARTVAAVLRRYPDSLQHFADIADDRELDSRLRAVLKADQ